MTILHSPLPALLFLGAALFTVAGAHWKRGHTLSFLGGLCWAAGTVCALVDEARLEEVLTVTLLLLLLSWNPRGKGGGG